MKFLRRESKSAREPRRNEKLGVKFSHPVTIRENCNARRKKKKKNRKTRGKKKELGAKTFERSDKIGEIECENENETTCARFMLTVADSRRNLRSKFDKKKSSRRDDEK